MATTQSLPNRGPMIMAMSILVTVLSTFFAVWRLIVRYKINPRLGWSDYWIMVALPLATAGHVLAVLSARDGEGRLDIDPFLDVDQVAKAQMWMFLHRCFNLYGMLFAKISICCYVLSLNFSRAYRITIYISLVAIICCLGLIPGIGHWAQCKPLAMRWDDRVKGRCIGGNQFKFVSGYLQAITNVITDVLYAFAPILYLRRVHLSRYTRIGVQGVFLCSLLCTGISLGKLIEFRRSYGKKDELWTSSISTILSVTENSVAIIVACLPPLRRTFDNFLKMVLPETILSRMGVSEPPSQNNALPTYYSKNRTKQDAGAVEDGESELAILPDAAQYVEDANGRIVKTTKVVVTNESSEFGKDGQCGR